MMDAGDVIRSRPFPVVARWQKIEMVPFSFLSYSTVSLADIAHR